MKTVRQIDKVTEWLSVTFSAGSPRRVKILDFQGLTLGHPAQDIWTIVYAATDPEYRAAHLEADLRAYHAVLATYMEDAAPDFSEFMRELEERRVYGLVLFSKFCSHIFVFVYVSEWCELCHAGGFCFVTLSPTQLPSPAKELSKFSAATNAILLAEDREGDHPDIR